ncbi:MAG: nucleoside recognition domain-containing protein [Bacillota bacterium]|nr:nucleoside recognition domain-containing protein [Bacillota bacterium]
MAFTSNASPLFMLGAISVGMLQNPALGPLIAGIHYFSNFLCGIILKFLTRSPSGCFPQPGKIKKSLLVYAIRTCQKASFLKEKSFGSLLGDTIRNASITLLTIGGFITLFSVLIGILQAVGLFSAIITILEPLTAFFNLDPSFFRALLYGFFEITIGIKEASKINGSLLHQLMIIEAILAWNGLAVQAQVTGMIIGSDLRILIYILTRFLQVSIAVLVTYIFTFLPLQEILSLPVFEKEWASSWSPVWFSIFPVGVFLFLIISGYSLSLLKSVRKKIIIIR